MIIPDKLSVGGHIFRVIKGYRFKEDRDLYGQTDLTMQEIRLADKADGLADIAESKKDEIFLHEVIHCVCNVYNAKLEEEDIKKLSEGLYQVLKTNGLLK